MRLVIFVFVLIVKVANILLRLMVKVANILLRLMCFMLRDVPSFDFSVQKVNSAHEPKAIIKSASSPSLAEVPDPPLDRFEEACRELEYDDNPSKIKDPDPHTKFHEGTKFPHCNQLPPHSYHCFVPKKTA